MGLSGGLRLPQGTTAQRPIVTNQVRYPGSSTQFADGTIRYNTTTNSLEALIAGEWEIVRAPGANTIRKQTLQGDGIEVRIGPLAEVPAMPLVGSNFDYNIMVFVENVFQISKNNYDIDFDTPGLAYLVFTEAPPSDKEITIYYGFAN
jgi:hypothetical protein